MKTQTKPAQKIVIELTDEQAGELTGCIQYGVSHMALTIGVNKLLQGEPEDSDKLRVEENRAGLIRKAERGFDVVKSFLYQLHQQTEGKHGCDCESCAESFATVFPGTYAQGTGSVRPDDQRAQQQRDR